MSSGRGKTSAIGVGVDGGEAIGHLWCSDMAAQDPLDATGLDEEQVRQRVGAGRGGRIGSRSSRSLADILRSNIATRFNAILGGLLVIVAVVGPPQDGLFGVVLVVNASIGIVQELRTKRALDRLAVMSAPVAHLVRSGHVADHPTSAVVEDDLMELRPGDQVVADGVVVAARGLQLDESLLTGESVAVEKTPGDDVLSGSMVGSGSGRIRVTRVGDEAFAQRMQLEAKQVVVSYSELQRGTNQILRVISFSLVPLAILLVTSQLLRSHMASGEALRGTVAGVGAMVPEGLVLLTTIAFALGALRLAHRNVLVQTLTSVEGLARVDVLCVDKTGTLTMPGMMVERVVEFDRPLADPLGALAASDPAPNETMRAVAARFDAVDAWVVSAAIPFSSERKWSATQFLDRGTWFLGAPEMLVHKGAQELLRDAIGAGPVERSQRVLAVAWSPGEIDGTELPPDVLAVGLVVMSERVRSDAAETVRFLVDQGVSLKVISGDDPGTVATIADRVGVPRLGLPLDGSLLPEDLDALADLAETTSVFGRVRPDQKRRIVEALQSRGHVVAMTGDGVNDIAALKRADVGIAMGSGSQASKAVANIVLLDSGFSSMPPILSEGRRVIANIERVANLFVTKTVYASVLALVVGALAVPYPFYPRQLTVVSSLTIGIPGFLLAFGKRAPRAEPHFVARTLRFALPAGLISASATFSAYLVARGPLHSSASNAKMAAVIELFAIALVVLLLLVRPLSVAQVGLVFLMAIIGCLASIVAFVRRLFALSLPPPAELLSVALILAAAVVALVAVLGRTRQLAGRSR